MTLFTLSGASLWRSRTRTVVARAAAYAGAGPFMLLIVLAAVMLVAALSAVTLVAQQRDPQSSQPPEGGRFRFKTAVDLINVSATVTDASERFVTGLRRRISSCSRTSASSRSRISAMNACR